MRRSVPHRIEFETHSFIDIEEPQTPDPDRKWLLVVLGLAVALVAIVTGLAFSPANSGGRGGTGGGSVVTPSPYGPPSAKWRLAPDVEPTVR